MCVAMQKPWLTCLCLVVSHFWPSSTSGVTEPPGKTHTPPPPISKAFCSSQSVCPSVYPAEHRERTIGFEGILLKQETLPHSRQRLNRQDCIPGPSLSPEVLYHRWGSQTKSEKKNTLLAKCLLGTCWLWSLWSFGLSWLRLTGLTSCDADSLS